MLTIESLPNTLTDYEHELFESNSRCLSFMGKVYLENDQEVELTEYIQSTDTFNGDSKVFVDLNFKDIAMEDIPRKIEFIIPSKNTIFKDFKSNLVIAPIIIDGLLNTEDPMIANLVQSSYEDEESAKEALSLSEYIIYNPEAMTFIYYNPSKKHVFTSCVGSDEMDFDSLDFALKEVFEWSVTECDYKLISMNRSSNGMPSFEQRLCWLKEWLDSDEGKESIEELKNEINASTKENEEFYHSEEFKVLATKTIPDWLRESDEKSLFSEDYQYGTASDFLDKETFFKFVNAVMGCNEGIEDRSAMFETIYVEIENLKVSMIHGQGTVYKIELRN